MRLPASDDTVSCLEGALLFPSNEGGKGTNKSLPELLCMVFKVEIVDELQEISAQVVVIAPACVVSLDRGGSTFAGLL